MNEVEFIRSPDWPKEVPGPIAMSELVPQWWRKMDEFLPDDGNFPMRTVKGCRPFMDQMVAGWALTLPQKLHFKADSEEDGGFVQWSWADQFGGQPMSHHGNEQFSSEVAKPPYIKLNMAFGIRTPPGWSMMFLPLWMHNTELPFSPVPALVDTDSYAAVVNLPCIWEKRPWEGVIDAGTPVAQVIPIKREDWRATERDWKDSQAESDTMKVRLFDRFYKRQSWHKKSWSKAKEVK